MAASLKVSELSGLSSLSLSDLLLISDIDADASKKVSFSDLQSNISLANLGTRSIDDLSDVDTSTVAPTNGQVLAWNSAAGEWQPATDQKHTQASLGVDHLITLSGVAEGSDHPVSLLSPLSLIVQIPRALSSNWKPLLKHAL